MSSNFLAKHIIEKINLVIWKDSDNMCLNISISELLEKLKVARSIDNYLIDSKYTIMIQCHGCNQVYGYIHVMPYDDLCGMYRMDEFVII